MRRKRGGGQTLEKHGRNRTENDESLRGSDGGSRACVCGSGICAHRRRAFSRGRRKQTPAPHHRNLQESRRHGGAHRAGAGHILHCADAGAPARRVRARARRRRQRTDCTRLLPRGPDARLSQMVAGGVRALPGARPEHGRLAYGMGAHCPPARHRRGIHGAGPYGRSGLYGGISP